MIIKSMSRKAPTFGQLIDYIGRNSDPQTGTKTRMQTFVHCAANAGGEPIVLKNYSLIVAQAADSICLLDRGICDVGTKAGGAGSTVL